MDQKSLKSKLQNFFQFGWHKPIVALDYYHPTFILKKKKKNQNQSKYKSSILQGQRAIIC